MTEQITLGELIKWTFPVDFASRKYVYLVRDHRSNMVFYVGGTTRYAPARIMEHLGLGTTVGGFPGGPTGLGMLIYKNRPLSNAWIAEFHDHKAILGDRVTFCSGANWWIENAEKVMIKRLRPCFNIADNPQGRSVPDAYAFSTTCGTSEE